MGPLQRYAQTILMLLPPAAMVPFYIWIFGLQGTLGAFLWGYHLFFIGLCMLSMLPLMVCMAWKAIASSQLHQYEPHDQPASEASRLATRVCTAISIICLVIILGLAAFIAIAGATKLEIPGSQVLLEPATGLPPAKTLAVAISSDPHMDRPSSDHQGTAQLLDTVRRTNYQAFFMLGDAVDSGLFPSGFNLALAELARGLGPIPLRAVMGNHDAVINGQGHFLQAFFPTGMKSDSGSPFFYSIDAGPVRFFVINLLWGAESFDATQQAWLDQALAATTPDKFKVVLSHAFIRASGYIRGNTGQAWYDNPQLIAELSPLLSRRGVDLVVSGHNHFMEYLEADGLHYALIGAMGGPSNTPISYRSPASRWLQRGTTGFLELSATAAQLDLVFREANGAELYRTRLFHPDS